MTPEQKEQFVILASAAWQVLDDMGREGHTCCEASKATLRYALEPFLPDIKYEPADVDYEYEAEVSVLKEVGFLR